MACNKRPVSSRELDSIVDAIEADINAKPRTEMTSHELGEMVMQKLRTVDEIAYVRFASVYRKFKDKEEFLKEMTKLLGD